MKKPLLPTMEFLFAPAFVVWLILSFATPSHAGTTVETKLHTGKIAAADYHEGKPGQPAVLILHGFLQTRAFPTVANAGETLADAGYTVLVPTLSLGISRRQQSLPCEAVHAHTFDGDVAEIDVWTSWLASRGHARIVLIGHSFGSVQILDYLNRQPSPAVAKALLISLTDVEVKLDTKQRTLLARELRDRIARKDKSLAEAEFGHCRKYVAPPAALLSYLSITRDSILNGLRKPPVPVEVLLGSADERMGADWADKLAARGVAVRIIDGANHFFDNQHEFELQDALLQGVKTIQHRKVGH